MLKLETLVDEIYGSLDWQRQPRSIDEYDIREIINTMVMASIRYLYVITARAEQYGESLFVYEGGEPIALKADLPADEYELVLAHTIVAFLRKVQTDVNNIVGYTTDAQSITNADKPYLYISTTIKEYLEHERRIYYKMVRFTIG